MGGALAVGERERERGGEGEIALHQVKAGEMGSNLRREEREQERNCAQPATTLSVSVLTVCTVCMGAEKRKVQTEGYGGVVFNGGAVKWGEQGGAG